MLPLQTRMDLGAMAMAPHSPKPQHHWNLTIRLLNVISRTLVGGGLTPLQRGSWCILQPKPTEQWFGLVGFYDISTIVGYLIPNPVFYIYIRYGEMVDFGKSDKMIKISGKVDKPILTTDSAMIFRSLFKEELHQNEN